MKKTGLFMLILTLLFAPYICRAQDKAYYEHLRERCEKNGNMKTCCLASLERMEEGGFKLADDNEEQNQNRCPPGYAPHMLKCLSSLVWCAPETK